MTWLVTDWSTRLRIEVGCELVCVDAAVDNGPVREQECELLTSSWCSRSMQDAVG